MGWFWADANPSTSVAPHPLPRRKDARPPPECPMHRSPAPKPTSAPTISNNSTASAGGCPYVPPDATPSSQSSRQTTISKLNPLNHMPINISNQRAEGQSIALGLDRETSTIQKEDGSFWEYPSPQQMYNAMLRKGYTDTPQDSVESMVAVHNFLNEGAWAEILEWERRFSRGLSHGWQQCRRGEDGSQITAGGGGAWQDAECLEPRLLRFQGRPGNLSPKARFQSYLSYLFPSRFDATPPFDRHDWYVQRYLPNGGSKEVRYVIDYYEGQPEPTGEPVFYLDVRPAIDTPTQACERLIRYGGDVWWRGTGGAVREQERARIKEEQEKHRVSRS